MLDTQTDALTLNQPITFDDMIAQIYDQYGLTKEALLRSYLNKLEAGGDVQIASVVEPDEEQMGVLHIANLPNEGGERLKGYNFYPVQVGNEVYCAMYSGYLGNLTADEERELMMLIKNQDRSERQRELLEIMTYHVSPDERAKRKQAAENPDAIKEYITLGEPMPFSVAFKQLCVLYSVWGDNHHIKMTKEYFRGFEDDDVVQFSMLLKDDGNLPNVLHLSKVDDRGGYTIYPEYYGREISSYDYSLTITAGIVGLLSHEEETEFAGRVIDGTVGDDLRRDELFAIRKGTLTREEAAELRRAKENTDPNKVWNWLEGQPERIQYLWDKSSYGFENIGAWGEWKKIAAEIQAEHSEKWRAEQIANRTRIATTLPDELKQFFTELVPTDIVLRNIKDRTNKGWTLVGVAGPDRQDKDKIRKELEETIGRRSSLDFRTDSVDAYDEDACHVPVEMHFARYGALERIRGEQGDQ